LAGSGLGGFGLGGSAFGGSGIGGGRNGGGNGGRNGGGIACDSPLDTPQVLPGCHGMACLDSILSRAIAHNIATEAAHQHLRSLFDPNQIALTRLP